MKRDADGRRCAKFSAKISRRAGALRQSFLCTWVKGSYICSVRATQIHFEYFKMPLTH